VTERNRWVFTLRGIRSKLSSVQASSRDLEDERSPLGSPGKSPLMSSPLMKGLRVIADSISPRLHLRSPSFGSSNAAPRSPGSEMLSKPIQGSPAKRIVKPTWNSRLDRSPSSSRLKLPPSRSPPQSQPHPIFGPTTTPRLPQPSILRSAVTLPNLLPAALNVASANKPETPKSAVTKRTQAFEPLASFPYVEGILDLGSILAKKPSPPNRKTSNVPSDRAPNGVPNKVSTMVSVPLGYFDFDRSSMSMDAHSRPGTKSLESGGTVTPPLASVRNSAEASPVITPPSEEESPLASPLVQFSFQE
jgi:hypothetical protein